MSLYIFNDDSFYEVPNSRNITPKGEDVLFSQLGLDRQSRYLFKADFKGDFVIDYHLLGTYQRPPDLKGTPPYSMIISGKFTKIKDGTIIYNGGFSIL